MSGFKFYRVENEDRFNFAVSTDILSVNFSGDDLKFLSRMGELISQAEFARRQGVSEATVSRAIRRGRITKNADGKIDRETQSIAWEANRSIEKDHGSRGMGQDGSIHEKYKQVLTTFKYFDAKLRELKYKELEGELISKENIQKTLGPKLTLIKSRMMGLPARHSHSLAALLIRHAEKCSKAKAFHKNLAKVDPQQLARDIAELYDSDMRSFLKEAVAAECFWERGVNG